MPCKQSDAIFKAFCKQFFRGQGHKAHLTHCLLLHIAVHMDLKDLFFFVEMFELETNFHAIMEMLELPKKRYLQMV